MRKCRGRAAPKDRVAGQRLGFKPRHYPLVHRTRAVVVELNRLAFTRRGQLRDLGAAAGAGGECISLKSAAPAGAAPLTKRSSLKQTSKGSCHHESPLPPTRPQT